MIKLFWSQNSIEQKFRRLRAKINNSFHDASSLDILGQFESSELIGEEMYNFLETIAMSHKNNKIRYSAVKLLYKNYPEKANDRIMNLLSHDPNYKLRIFNLDDSETYNFNELVNLNIKQIRNRDKLVDDIFAYNYIEFALSWQDYLDLFNVFYNVELNCFLLNFKKSQEVAYLCNIHSDPFYSLRVGKILSASKMRDLARNSSKMRVVIEFFKRFFQAKNTDIKALSLRPEQEASLPNFRIFCDTGEFLIYLHL